MIIVPMPIFIRNNDGKADIDSVNSRHNYINFSMASAERKLNYLEEEKEIILNALQDNERAKQMILNGEIKEGLKKAYDCQHSGKGKIIVGLSLASLSLLSIPFWGYYFPISADLLYIFSLMATFPAGLLTAWFGLKNKEIKEGYKNSLVQYDKFMLVKNINQLEEQKLLENKYTEEMQNEEIKTNNAVYEDDYDYYLKMDELLREKYMLCEDPKEKQIALEKLKRNFIKMTAFINQSEEKSNMELILK